MLCQDKKHAKPQTFYLHHSTEADNKNLKKPTKAMNTVNKNNVKFLLTQKRSVRTLKMIQLY